MSATDQFAKGFRKGAKNFSQLIALLVNTAMLTLVYFTGVAASSIIGKLTGKSFLKTKPDKKAATYWEELDLKKRPLEEYYRQF